MGRTRANRISASIKNKFAQTNQGKQVMSVGEYIERMYFRQQCFATLVNGVMRVLVNGVWLSDKEFDKLYPKPVVQNFNHDATNVDGTRKWMYE